jgi:hypothetical protein
LDCFLVNNRLLGKNLKLARVIAATLATTSLVYLVFGILYQSFTNHQEVVKNVESYIYFYNYKRIHSVIGYITPAHLGVIALFSSNFQNVNTFRPLFQKL